MLLLLQSHASAQFLGQQTLLTLLYPTLHPNSRSVNNGCAVALASRAADAQQAPRSAAAPRPVSSWAAVVVRGAGAPAPAPAPAHAPAPAPADQAWPATAAEAAAPATRGAEAGRGRSGPSALPQPAQPGGMLAKRAVDGAQDWHGPRVHGIGSDVLHASSGPCMNLTACGLTLLAGRDAHF